MTLYHGTRASLAIGAAITPESLGAPFVRLTATLDEAIWDAELADGELAARVYVVESTATVEEVPPDQRPPGRLSMSLCARGALRVIGEVTEWVLYHGTRADLRVGDLIEPGRAANFGAAPRLANHVYMARTLDAATWGAELAAGDGPGRIYIVEPTGPIEDDPNLTDKKFRGNPTKSFRSRAPLRVTGELTGWKGHPPERVRAMKEGLARLAEQGLARIDD